MEVISYRTDIFFENLLGPFLIFERYVYSTFGNFNLFVGLPNIKPLEELRQYAIDGKPGGDNLPNREDHFDEFFKFLDELKLKKHALESDITSLKKLVSIDDIKLLWRLLLRNAMTFENHLDEIKQLIIDMFGIYNLVGTNDRQDQGLVWKKIKDANKDDRAYGSRTLEFKLNEMIRLLLSNMIAEVAKDVCAPLISVALSDNSPGFEDTSYDDRSEIVQGLIDILYEAIFNSAKSENQSDVYRCKRSLQQLVNKALKEVVDEMAKKFAEEAELQSKESEAIIA